MRHASPPTRPSRVVIHFLGAFGALMLGIAASVAPAAIAGAAVGGGHRISGSAAGRTTCPAGATCATIPAQCPKTTACPTVAVLPATSIGANQWVYVDLWNFQPSNGETGAESFANIYLCDDNTPLTESSPPYCMLQGPYPNTYEQVAISPSGTGQTAFETLDNPHQKGSVPFVGQIPTDSSATPVNFYCGDTADRCSVDVQAQPPGVQASIPTPADTAVVPLGFAASSQGCPQATLVTTSSDNSVNWLFSGEASYECTGKAPALPFNTPSQVTGTLGALASLSTDGVSFVEDPQAADVQAALASTPSTVVPIVASADVIAYIADMQADSLKYTYNSFKLTPDEVAGLASFDYQGTFDADMVSCPGGQCSAMAELNSVPPGFVGPETYAVFIPGVDSGLTESLTDWVCNAPNLPFVAGGRVLHDPNTAQKTFTSSIDQKPWPIKSCTTFDRFPALDPVPGAYIQVPDDDAAIKALRAYASQDASENSSLLAGFAPLDWDDAQYNGLDSAALQNADGQFVTATPASVDAELAGLKLSPQGYPIPDPTHVVNGGYPMSTVIDAIVPDKAPAGILKTQTADMLTSLLDYTATDPLPNGYAPLPSDLQGVAKKNLAKVLTDWDAPVPVSTTTTASASPSSVVSGSPVAYSAKVATATGSSSATTPTGTVAFRVGSATLCTATLSAGAGACSASDAPVGADPVTAAYSGATGFSASSGDTTVDVASGSPPTTFPLSTAPPSSIPVTSAPATSTPATLPGVTTTVPAKAKGSGGGDLTVASVRLSAAEARIILPIALILGGTLLFASLCLMSLGTLRRRKAAVVQARDDRPGPLHG